MQQVLRCGTIWHHYNDDFINSDLIGQKCLNDWHVVTVDFNQTWQKASLGKEDLSLFKWKGHTFLHWEKITKLQKYIHEIKKSPPELLGQFYNIYNYNFAQM